MTVSSSPHPHPDIVARLRAAGCVFAEDEARLLTAAARTPADLAAMVDRRAAGLPLEQVLGWAEFCGLRITVAPGVFVPRHRTEFLARQAIALARRDARPGVPVIIDLCCGSGAVGAALAAALGPVELHAADIDPAAVRCARGNLAAASGHVYEGDLYAPLPAALRGRVRILVANVPYVPSAEVGLLPAEARIHEPRAALDGGADGLDVLRRVAAAAPQWLAPGGHLLVEASQRQAARAAAELTQAGLAARVDVSAEFRTAVLTGTRAAVPGGGQPLAPPGP
jgi:release factor glutamine methyltransferase